MDTWFNQDQTELAVFVFTIAFQMLADSDSFLDQVVQIFWDIWTQTQRFQDAQDFVTAYKTNLGNTVWITKNDTYLN